MVTISQVDEIEIAWNPTWIGEISSKTATKLTFLTITDETSWYLVRLRQKLSRVLIYIVTNFCEITKWEWYTFYLNWDPGPRKSLIIKNIIYTLRNVVYNILKLNKPCKFIDQNVLVKS